MAVAQELSTSQPEQQAGSLLLGSSAVQHTRASFWSHCFLGMLHWFPLGQANLPVPCCLWPSSAVSTTSRLWLSALATVLSLSRSFWFSCFYKCSILWTKFPPLLDHEFFKPSPYTPSWSLGHFLSQSLLAHLFISPEGTCACGSPQSMSSFGTLIHNFVHKFHNAW